MQLMDPLSNAERSENTKMPYSIGGNSRRSSTLQSWPPAQEIASHGPLPCNSRPIAATSMPCKRKTGCSRVPARILLALSYANCWPVPGTICFIMRHTRHVPCCRTYRDRTSSRVAIRRGAQPCRNPLS